MFIERNRNHDGCNIPLQVIPIGCQCTTRPTRSPRNYYKLRTRWRSVWGPICSRVTFRTAYAFLEYIPCGTKKCLDAETRSAWNCSSEHPLHTPQLLAPIKIQDVVKNNYLYCNNYLHTTQGNKATINLIQRKAFSLSPTVIKASKDFTKKKHESQCNTNQKSFTLKWDEEWNIWSLMLN